MATLAELAALRTALNEPVIDHLLRLTASWSLLADLSFSDMLLMARVEGTVNNDSGFVVMGQMRPNNRSTMINDDLVGTTHDATSWPLVHLAFESGTRIIGEVNVEAIDEVVPVWCVPVRFDGRVVAVMVRLQGPLRGPASLYEQAYLSIFERLCVMVVGRDVPVS